ncbi:MAG: hypothetical protein V9H69_18080 [Anaerolineae bacterium]
MTANELFTIIAQVSGLLGIVGSMLGMGLGLTMAQIVQPLKNVRLVVLALLANFVLVPLLAWGISLIIPLEDCAQGRVDGPGAVGGRALPGAGGARAPRPTWPWPSG